MENYSIKGDWWKDKTPHESIFALIKYIDTHQSARRQKNIMHARLYSNSEILGLESANHLESPQNSIFADRDTRIRLNVIASVVDTISSKIAKNRPKVVMLPIAGDHDLQLRARDLEKFVGGLFYGTNIYEEATRMFLDTCIFGTGIMKIFTEEDGVCAERVIPSEIIVDDEEGFRGKPRQIHQKRDVARDVLYEMFPDKTRLIDEAGLIKKEFISVTNSLADNVTVVESWHLPSGPEAEDGKHVISIDTGTLFEEEYNKKDFPFVFLRWKDPVVGFWGIGVAEDITGIQVEINKLLLKIQKSFHHLSNPMVFVNSASAISKAHINNKIGIIVPYTGQPPTIRAAQTVHPEVFNHLERLYMRAFDIAGVSQLAATSRKPDGLDSGAALREFNDIESERFSLVSQRYESFFIEVAKKMIDVARDLYSGDSDIEVSSKGKKFIEKIKWSEVSMEDDKFALVVSAASALPQTRAGRVQRASEWFAAGLISGTEWRELLEIPDLEDNTELMRGPRDYIRQVVTRILKDGKMIPPEPMDDLQFAMEFASLSYQEAKLNEVDEDKIELLKEYIDSVSFIMDQLKAQAVNEQVMLNQYAQQLNPAPAAQTPQQPGKPPQPVEGVPMAK